METVFSQRISSTNVLILFVASSSSSPSLSLLVGANENVIGSSTVEEEEDPGELDAMQSPHMIDRTALHTYIQTDAVLSGGSVTGLGGSLDFEQIFKAFGNN